MRQLLITLAATAALVTSASAAKDLTAEERSTLISFGGPTLIADPQIQDELGLEEATRSWVDAQLANTLEAHRDAGNRFRHIGRQAQLAQQAPRFIAKPDVSESALIEEARKKALDSFRGRLTIVLSPAQVVRLDQLAIQALGLAAFESEAVRKKLRLSKTQRSEIDALLQACQLDRNRIASERSPDSIPRIMARNAEAYDAVEGVFTEEQGEIWFAMVGPRYTPPPRPGRIEDPGRQGNEK